jgi:hypothetical protein
MPGALARSEPAAAVSPPRPRAWRWLAVFVVVTLLHWLAAEWIERHRGVPPPVRDVHVPVQVALLKPERIEREAQPAAAGAAHKAAPQPARRPANKPREPHELRAVTPPKPQPKVEAAQAASTPAETANSSASAAPVAASSAAAGNGAGNGNTAHAGAGNGNTPSAQASQASHGVKFSIPPSGELQYDTFYNGVRNQPGTIHWASDGQHYEMVVSVPLPFIGSFSWTSRGHVDAFGLAPDQYIEKRGHRPSDVTIFNRDQKQIIFTRTPNSLPLQDGAQDRFSMVMQLASLVRGDPEAYKPGVTREFFVADNDSGEVWPVTTIGDESVSTDHGFVTARHFMRLPRREGDKRRIDVWLAPSLGWLPVRLVQTEPNGTQFELVWRGPIALPTASGAGAPGTSTSNEATQTTAPNADHSEAPASASGSAPDNVQPDTAQPQPQPAPGPSSATEPAAASGTFQVAPSAPPSGTTPTGNAPASDTLTPP